VVSVRHGAIASTNAAKLAWAAAAICANVAAATYGARAA